MYQLIHKPHMPNPLTQRWLIEQNGQKVASCSQPDHGERLILCANLMDTIPLSVLKHLNQNLCPSPSGQFTQQVAKSATSFTVNTVQTAFNATSLNTPLWRAPSSPSLQLRI